jgi:hypothetical protein
MSRFSLGLAVGLLLGSAVTTFSARMVGEPGFLLGWEVTKDGENICSDPFVWPGTMEIECE